MAAGQILPFMSNWHDIVRGIVRDNKWNEHSIHRPAILSLCSMRLKSLKSTAWRIIGRDLEPTILWGGSIETRSCPMRRLFDEAPLARRGGADWRNRQKADSSRELLWAPHRYVQAPLLGDEWVAVCSNRQLHNEWYRIQFISFYKKVFSE